jgi:hypothetical protein
MSNQTVVPERAALRALYDEAILAAPNRDLLTTPFYMQIGDAVFEACYQAMGDAVANTHRMLTVPAPCGAGKTSFAYSFAVALTRYAENNPNAASGVVFLVERRDKADNVYSDLEALLPGKVRVWTSDHDIASKKQEKVVTPAIKGRREDLASYPIAIVTHSFYLDRNGHLAKTFVRNGKVSSRVLTIVDEQPKAETPSVTLTLAEAETARETLVEVRPELKPHLDALFQLMEPCNYGPANKLYRLGKELPRTEVERDLAWFRSKDAHYLAQTYADKESIKNFLDFAKAFGTGYGWAATDGRQAEFYAYQTQLIVNEAAGTVLLDATADLDGISSVVQWREPVATVAAEFDNLEIILIPQITKEPINTFLRKAANQRAYVQWMEDTIRNYAEPEQKGLVVCKLTLFDQECVPTWPKGDERFKDANNYTKGYQWDLEGRKLSAIHYGTGIGDNFWNDASVVFLFDEHILPKSAAVSQAQALTAQRVDQGDLGAMKTLRSKPAGVRTIADGHRLRQLYQLILRGNARNYDAHGVCGKQRAVIACDPKLFMSSAARMFPGANIRIERAPSGTATVQTQILDFLSNTTQNIVTQKEIRDLVGKEWRAIAHYVKRSGFLSSIASLGWKYENRKGRLGSYFKRLLPNQSEGVLSAYMRAQP